MKSFLKKKKKSIIIKLTKYFVYERLSFHPEENMWRAVLQLEWILVSRKSDKRLCVGGS